MLHAVVNSLDCPPNTVAVEVGPGKGALTEYILKKYTHVVGIEKDDLLMPVLGERFAGEISSGNLILVNGDIRDRSWLDFVRGKEYVVVANIPYYLTGSLIRDFLASAHPPLALSLIVQKEVAERITRRGGGKESLLSLSVNLFGTATYVKTVPRRSFSPQPKVDSAIITITDVQQPLEHVRNAFFLIIKTAFREKRKYALKKFSHIPQLQRVLTECGVSPTDRG